MQSLSEDAGSIRQCYLEWQLPTTGAGRWICCHYMWLLRRKRKDEARLFIIRAMTLRLAASLADGDEW